MYRQIVGIPMGTNCIPPVADLFLFCYKGYFILSLSDKNQAGVIKTFNSTSTSRYLDDLLNIYLRAIRTPMQILMLIYGDLYQIKL